MKTAVIYARVSTEEQAKKYSLSSQLEECRKYADSYEYTVVAEFAEAFSGEILDRPRLSEVFGLCQNTKVDVLIVYDIDRLARNTAHHAIIEMQLEKCSTEIEYVLGEYNSKSPEANLSKSIKRAISEYENMQRRERVTRGKNAKVRAGKVMTAARPPYGYSYHAGELFINPEEAEVVRRIFRLMVEGETATNIARILHEDGVLTRGDKVANFVKMNGVSIWNPSTIKNILNNETYTGAWHFGKTMRTKVNGKSKSIKKSKSEWVKVEVPAIIEREQFESAGKALRGNKILAKRNVKWEYLLRGMINCSCGAVCRCSRSRRKKEFLFYQCTVTSGTYWRKPCSERFYVGAQKIEQIVWEKVMNVIFDPDYLRFQIEKQRISAEAGLSGAREQFEAVKLAITDTERKLGILIDQMLDGDFPKEIIEERKRLLSSKLRQLQAEKDKLEFVLSEASITPEQEDLLNQLIKNIKHGVDKASFEHKQKLLQMLKIRVVALDKKRIKISGILPISEHILDLDQFAATTW